MQCAVYYFPNYHQDKRNAARHGAGWNEWELMKLARPRFPGHDQPKIPLWGYEDEADPVVMAKKIDTAAKYGVDSFIFDWYWYDGPFLQRCLDEGYLKAANKGKIKFALMWANHDWSDIHPKRHVKGEEILYPWSATRESVGFVWDYVIENYLTRPEYWNVEGLPYFSIYATNRFIQQMGGKEATREVLAEFRAKAKKAGLPGVHINGIWFDNLEQIPSCVCPQKEWVDLGFTSYTSYNGMDLYFPELGFPVADFDKDLDGYLECAKHALSGLPGPYYPCVTTGWDSSPRCLQSDHYELYGYPWLPVIEHSPKCFAKALRKTLDLIKDKPEAQKILIINAWNEWTEGSYLEPDEKDGYGMLEELQKALNDCK